MCVGDSVTGASSEWSADCQRWSREAC